MKKILILLIIITSIFLFGCSKAAIENTINKFQDAVNNGDADALENVMSPDSDFYKTYTFDSFISDNFSGFTPLEYKNLDINIDSSSADVNADAYYLTDPLNPVKDDVLFVMRKVDNFFSFIFPEWKVYQYYDGGNFNRPNDAVWRKIKNLKQPK